MCNSFWLFGFRRTDCLFDRDKVSGEHYRYVASHVFVEIGLDKIGVGERFNGFFNCEFVIFFHSARSGIDASFWID